MTKEEVKKLLMTTEALYPNFKVVDRQTTLDAWHMLLEDQDANLIFAALKNYARNSKSDFAPNPGKLIQAAYDLRNMTMLSEVDAWNMVYKALCRGAYDAEEEFEKFPIEVKRAVGSPMQLRAWATDPYFNEGVASSNFRKSYATACDRQKQEALIPAEVRVLIEQLTIPALTKTEV